MMPADQRSFAAIGDTTNTAARLEGMTKGTVGERMQALGNDPRYKFAEGDKGRAEIMAFIAETSYPFRRERSAYSGMINSFISFAPLPSGSPRSLITRSKVVFASAASASSAEPASEHW